MKKKHTPRAQTTRLASFEPFSVVATFHWHTLPVAYFTGYNLYKTLVSIKKHEEKKGKNTGIYVLVQRSREKVLT